MSHRGDLRAALDDRNDRDGRGADDGDPPASDLFLGGEGGLAAYADAIDRARDAVVAAHADRDQPYSGRSHAELRAAVDRAFGGGEASETPRGTGETGDAGGDRGFPDEGVGLDAAVADVREAVLDDSVFVSDPTCAAHLQCPPLVPALAAEVLLTAFNQSMDSWDQAPAATAVEERTVAALSDAFDYPSTADGVFTSGGTQSNLMGLLLARNRRVEEAYGRDPQAAGLPPEADDMRILCSEAAHFTAEQAAAQLGLGEDAVVHVATDDRRRMRPEALDAALDDLTDRGLDPFAVVGTAGTTDLGAIDPLEALADRAEERDFWFHVDAAYGGALALSDAHRDRLAGVERADSLAVDFHKLFYQPLSCGAFLVRDGDEFGRIARNAAYLNPEGDDAPNLVAKSVQTSRRFDALKPYLTFRALGRERLAELVESTLRLADDVADRIAADPYFELAAEPSLDTVVFRCTPDRDHPTLDADEWADRLNREVRDRLLDDGAAVVARTEVDGRAYLKFTLLNPLATVADAADVLGQIRAVARAVDPADVVEDGEGGDGDGGTSDHDGDVAAVEEGGVDR